MGRKIPGRKHRGVRDIEKQRQTRQAKSAGKVNDPPPAEDDQPMPNSLKRLMEAKEKMAQRAARKSRPAKPDKDTVIFRPVVGSIKNTDVVALPACAQQKGESDKSFMNRVSQGVRQVIREASFEKKYRVHIQRNAQTAEVEQVVKAPKDPLELFREGIRQEKREARMKKKRKNKTNEPPPPEPAMSRSQRKRDKEKLKRLNHKRDIIEDLTARKTDYVSFGDVNHAPPTLSAPSRILKSSSTKRPGQKSLLLNNIMKPGVEHQKSHSKDKKQHADNKKVGKIQNKPIDKQGKRKNLPVALRRQLDNQRAELVNAYKEIKKHRIKK